MKRNPQPQLPLYQQHETLPLFTVPEEPAPPAPFEYAFIPTKVLTEIATEKGVAISYEPGKITLVGAIERTLESKDGFWLRKETLQILMEAS